MSQPLPGAKTGHPVPGPVAAPPPLPLKALNHLALTSTHLEATRAFYTDVLGFREVSRPAFSFRGAWLYNYGLMIHIIEKDSAGTGSIEGEISTRDNHFALHADDLDAAEQALLAHGVPYRKNEIPERKIRQLFFRDLDGNHIEVGTYPAALPPFI
jgi:catechol 2,3-dioxygenase-like lactoylglutathione lyase family enzyme